MEFFDLHCDTLYKAVISNCSLYENELAVSLLRGTKYTPWIQCFAVWIPDDCRNMQALQLFDNAVKKLHSEIELYSHCILQCATTDELKLACDQQKCGAILTVEGSGLLGGKLETLNHLHDCGVKVITLTWNGSCEVGDGVMLEHGRGLTPFGRQVIPKMEQLGIVVDLSHASEQLFYDVSSIAAKPFIATHSNAKKLCSHKRNLTDEQFLAIKKSGGIVGLNFAPEFLENDCSKAGFSSILRHAEHFLSLGGEHTVCIGSDFDGTDLPNGMEGIQSIQDLYEYFLIHNYNETMVKAIFFENAYKFFTTL